MTGNRAILIGMRRLLFTVALAAVAAGVVQPEKSEARWPWEQVRSQLCYIKPPDPPAWSGARGYDSGRLFGRIETKCKRNVPFLTVTACLTRFPDLLALDFPALKQCRTKNAYGDYAAVATVAHLCDYTNYPLFWRVSGFAEARDPKIDGGIDKSPIVLSAMKIATCE